MSALTIAWSMCAAASLMLGLMHLSFWLVGGRALVYFLSALMAFAAGTGALLELAMMRADSIAVYSALMRWENLTVFLILVPMVWFVYAHFGTARRWLALTISGLWALVLVLNFLSPASVVFREITELRQAPTFWGETFTIAVGTPNPWVHLANLASLFILVYIVDASIRAWRRGKRRQAVVVGGAVTLFIVSAGIHAPLVDAGLVATPYMVSFAFLAIVLAMSYELVATAAQSERYARRVRANEERWRTLLENVQLAVIGVDPDGRIDYANPYLCNLIGYRSEELVGRGIASLMPPSDGGELAYRLRRAAEDRPRPHSEWTLVCASGEERRLSWSTVKLVDAEGAFVGLLSVGQDITARLRAERDLQRVQLEMDRLARANLLGELAAALAHELNQPLTAILSNAQAGRRFLAGGNPDLYELGDILDDIVRDDKRAGEVIRRLRALFGSGKVVRERLSLNPVVREVLELVTAEIDARGVALETELADDIPLVLAGRVEVQQVLMNLLLNALRAVGSMQQRRICLGTRRDGTRALVWVQDSGPGVPQEQLDSVFDSFSTSKADGLGMGLAVCRRIIEAHGSRIWAENPEGGGSRFSFTLPLAEEGPDD